MVPKVGFVMAQTPPWLAYYRWNRKQKALRFKESFAKQEELVLSIMPPKSQAVRETSGFEEP